MSFGLQLLDLVDPLHIIHSDSSPASGPTQVQIEQELALQVQQALAAKGMSAPDAKIQESAGYNINLYNAWQSVLSDPTVVQAVVNKTVSDLIASNLVTGAPGTSAAGMAVTSAGTVAPVGSAGAPIAVPSSALLIGGFGILALVLLKGGHHGNPRRR